MAWPPFTVDNVLSTEEMQVSMDGTPFSSNLSRNYKRQFRVIVDNAVAGANNVCNLPGIPAPFAPYTSEEGSEFDLNALCVKISAALQNPDDRMVWIVTCDYSTEMPEGGPSNAFFGMDTAGAQNNPEMEPWTLEWEPETVSKAYQQDLFGDAFLSSAGRPFKPAPTYEAARAVLVFTRNQLIFTREDITNYAFAVNSDDFLGASPGSAQCLPPRGKLMFRGNISYWRVSWKIRFGAPLPGGTEGDLEKWSPVKILDQDTYHIQNIAGAPDVGEPAPIFIQGVAITDPVLLDGQGQRLPIGSPPEYMEYYIYKARAFNALFLAGGNLDPVEP